MKVVPIPEGGLRIEIATPSDWLLLEQIAPDALKIEEKSLSSRFSALMDKPSEWDEVVVPDLNDLFDSQISCVQHTVQEARKGPPDSSDHQLFISPEDGPRWYGALNQARIALESYYRFGTAQEISEVESFPEAKRAAFIRSQLYSALQSVLLEHVID